MSIQDRDTDFIVESVSENGKPFRPSDWVERISTQLASYGPDHRLRYDENVHPCVIDGSKCLCVKRALKEDNPSAYQFILKFAEDNHLRVQEDRRKHPEDRRHYRDTLNEPLAGDRRSSPEDRRNS